MKNDVILITGASKGLGRETARLLARSGVSLVLTARGAEALAETVHELRADAEVVALAGDVADRAHAERLVQVGLERFGRIDVLINNASSIGPSPMPRLEAYPLDAFGEVMRLNVGAPLNLTQLVLPGMRQRGRGAIVNVSSDAAVNAYPGWGGYGVSKAALEHLSRVLAAELEGSGVRVYVLDPGDMDTELHRLAEPGVDLSHLPGPEPAARALLRLLDDHRPSGRYTADAIAREERVEGTASQRAAARPLAEAELVP